MAETKNNSEHASEGESAEFKPTKFQGDPRTLSAFKKFADYMFNIHLSNSLLKYHEFFKAIRPDQLGPRNHNQPLHSEYSFNPIWDSPNTGPTLHFVMNALTTGANTFKKYSHSINRVHANAAFYDGLMRAYVDNRSYEKETAEYANALMVYVLLTEIGAPVKLYTSKPTIVFSDLSIDIDFELRRILSFFNSDTPEITRAMIACTDRHTDMNWFFERLAMAQGRDDRTKEHFWSAFQAEVSSLVADYDARCRHIYRRTDDQLQNDTALFNTVEEVRNFLVNDIGNA